MTNEVTFTEPILPAYDAILTPAAIEFVAHLADKFTKQRNKLLAARVARQKRLDAGEMPDFLPETQHIRDGDWKVAPNHPALANRRVEITGPTDRKMVINALNSGASVFMADLEDANAPSWDNMVDGQLNLRDAVRRTITYTNETGKLYELAEKTPVNRANGH